MILDLQQAGARHERPVGLTHLDDILDDHAGSGPVAKTLVRPRAETATIPDGLIGISPVSASWSILGWPQQTTPMIF
jgi:hypothetical protein